MTVSAGAITQTQGPEWAGARVAVHRPNFRNLKSDFCDFFSRAHLANLRTISHHGKS